MEKSALTRGRKSTLTNEVIEKANAYLIYDFQNVGDIVTSAVGLAQYLGVTKSVVYQWAELDSELGREFKDTLRACVEKQEKMLISGGLGGAYNSTITKLMMANHGYHEKPQQADDSEETIESVTVSIKSAKKSRD
jgi:hypothetical protein